MTIETDVRKVDLLSDGSNRQWPFAFRVYDDGDVVLSYFTEGTSAWTEVPAEDYTVNLGPGNAQDGFVGGTVIYPVAPETALGSGYTVRVERTLDFTQTRIDLSQASGFDPRAVEAEFDRHVALMQQIKDGEIEGAVSIPPGMNEVTLPRPGAGLFIRWNGAGTALDAASATFTRDAYAFESVAEIEASMLTPGPDQIVLMGRFAYVRAPAGQMQSADGQWWAPALPVCAAQFGALDAGTGLVNRVAIQAMFDYVALLSDNDSTNGFNSSITMIIDGSYTIDNTLTMPDGTTGVNLVCAGALVASDDFPLTTDTYMIDWKCTRSELHNLRFDGNRRAFGCLAIEGGRINVVGLRATHFIGKGLTLRGTQGDMKILGNTNIRQWAASDPEFDDDESFTGTGVSFETGDCMMYGGNVHYNGINYDFVAGLTTQLHDVHPYNGRASGPVRVDAKNIVVREGAGCRIYNSYIDNGQIDVYGHIHIRHCWYVGDPVSSEFTNEAFINIYATEPEDTARNIVIDGLWSAAGLSAEGYSLIRFRPNGGNTWAGTMTDLHETTAPFLHRHYTLHGTTTVLLSMGSANDPSEVVVHPRGNITKEWYPGAFIDNPITRKIHADTGHVEYNTRGFRVRNPVGDDTLYLGTNGHNIRQASGLLQLRNVDGNGVEIGTGVGPFRPIDDNAQNCGTSSNRWDAVWSVDGSINTSDAREKAWLGRSSAEENIARDLTRLPGLYQWLSAIATKGATKARRHIGVTAQAVAEVFRHHGADPFEYGVLCWDEVPGGDRYSIRYGELNVWLNLGNWLRNEDLERRLIALETALTPQVTDRTGTAPAPNPLDDLGEDGKRYDNGREK